VETKPISGRTRGLAEAPPGPVLVADLDGTVLKTDLLLESLLVLLKHKPYCLFLLPIWLWRGRAYFKQQIARRAELDASVLPYRTEVLEYLKGERAAGRLLVLATGADVGLARRVADHLKIFDLVLASDGVTNLAGRRKRDRLVSIFGAQGFDYIANGWRDLPVWAAAREAIVVEPDPILRARVERTANLRRVFEHPSRSLIDLARPLRFRHWLKNVLVFVPLLATHRFFEAALLVKVELAFLAFGFCASGGYVLNDLLDLAADRRHPDKRLRPFASGDLPLGYGLTLLPVLIGLGMLIAWLISPLFLGVLCIYLVLTATYSLFARKVVLLDVIVLAGLYTMRILAGSAAIAVWPSQWLLAFSTFLFFSLALVKRYGELVIMRRVDGEQAKARGYELSDGELLAAMGAASGYVAVLVLALYVESSAARSLYGRYEVIWLLCPLLLYWISHIWLFAHRGKMPDDPVVFATHDRASRILIALMALVILVAL
jgi:4-hydroxybenzoate polyprenyltransferase